MVNQIVVLNRVIDLPLEMDEAQLEGERLYNLVNEIDPEAGAKMQTLTYTTRIEGDTLHVSRADDQFG